MIATWMLYCVTLGMLFIGAGLLIESVVQQHGGATRRVWALAMAGAVLVPVAGILVRDGTVASPNGPAAASPLVEVMGDGVDLFAILDGMLMNAWLLGSGALLLLLLACGIQTWLRHRTWGTGEVDGVPVLVSDEVGPAVVGFLQGRIVMPEWVMNTDDRQRAVMLRHELEHLTGHDPQLLLFSLALLVAMPWNLPLWYMAHRLRVAVEVDCDRRVLEGGRVDKRTYGELLLNVGMRRSTPAYTVAGLARSRSLLEHRIDRMTLPSRRGRMWRSAALAVVATGVMAAAWSLPQPVRAADVSGHFLPCPADAAAPPNSAPIPG